MTLEDYFAKHGATATANKLIDQRISKICGLGKDDLADTTEMDSLFQEVADHLDSGDFKSARESVRAIDLEWLEENEFGY